MAFETFSAIIVLVHLRSDIGSRRIFRAFGVAVAAGSGLSIFMALRENLMAAGVGAVFEGVSGVIDCGGSLICGTDRMTLCTISIGVCCVVGRICSCEGTIVAGSTIFDFVCTVIETFDQIDGLHFFLTDGVAEVAIVILEIGVVCRNDVA